MSDNNLAKMTEDEIQSKIISVTAELFKKEASQISLDTHLVDDLHADSLDTVEFTLAIEDAFNIEIPDSAAGKVVTVNDVLQYVLSLRNTGSSSTDTSAKSAN
jgi:acyl carrier protein